jgi:hypothetical protein
MKRCILFLLGLISAVPAMAEVIYRWHTVFASPELPGFDAVLRITDEAYWRGNAYINYDGCGGIPCLAPLADAGILYMGFSFALGSDGHKPPLSSGVYDRFDLQFDHLGGVTGRISYNSTAVELDMSGNALWTVDLVRGDPYIGTPCGGPTFCSGTKGYFLAESLPVPEPQTAWLLLAGLAVLSMKRRGVVSPAFPRAFQRGL